MPPRGHGKFRYTAGRRMRATSRSPSACSSGLQALPLLPSSAAVAMAHGETAGTGDPAGRCAGPPATRKAAGKAVGTAGPSRANGKDDARRPPPGERTRWSRPPGRGASAADMSRSEMAFAAPVKGELMVHRARDSLLSGRDDGRPVMLPPVRMP